MTKNGAHETCRRARSLTSVERARLADAALCVTGETMQLKDATVAHDGANGQHAVSSPRAATKGRQVKQGASATLARPHKGSCLRCVRLVSARSYACLESSSSSRCSDNTPYTQTHLLRCCSSSPANTFRTHGAPLLYRLAVLHHRIRCIPHPYSTPRLRVNGAVCTRLSTNFMLVPIPLARLRRRSSSHR